MALILIIGEDTRSFLTVIRSLGEIGHIIDIVCLDNTSPSKKSKYIRNCYSLNYHSHSIQEFRLALEDIIKVNSYDLVIPCDERSIYPLKELSYKTSINTLFSLPNNSMLDVLFDKNSTKELCLDIGIPTAKHRYGKLSRDSYIDLFKFFNGKFVLKPTHSFSKEVLNKRNQVVIIENESDYSQFFEKNNNDNNEYLVEEFFEGYGVGVSIHAVNGEITHVFSHKRVHEPQRGGGSSYRQSIETPDVLLDACSKICKKTDYTGVGMFEFKFNDQTQAWILIEVNARFWGSLPLAVYAGVNFPRILVDHLLNKNLPQKKQILTKYRTGVYSRDLSADIFNIHEEISKSSNLFSKVITTGMWISSFLRICLLKEKIDSFSIKDTKPFFIEIKNFLLDNVISKIDVVNKIRNNIYRKNLLNTLDNLAKRKQPIHIVFVCYGNIIRSPYSEKFMKNTFTSNRVNFFSAGIHQKEGRSSPIDVQNVSSEFKVCLNDHRSKFIQSINHNLVDNIVYFYFDFDNRTKLNKYFTLENTFPITCLIPNNIFKEIKDPFGKDSNEIRLTYGQISECLVNLNNILAKFKQE